jgi:hypothetical protein
MSAGFGGISGGWAGVALWVAMGLGCSGEGALPPGDFPGAFVRATCQRARQCCAPDASAQNRDRQLDCEVNREFVAALMGELDQAVDAQRVAYNPAMAARCLMTIHSAGCGPSIDVTRVDAASRECAGTVHGLIALGAPCLSGWDCAPGLFCDRSPVTVQHRCVLRRAEGLGCARDEQCTSGSCRLQRCQPALPMCLGY